jgi:hypothetical protein
MHRTNLGLLSVRSALLKRVDAAMKNNSDCVSYRYLEDLGQEFDQWKREKGDWKKSDRNGKGAVTDLGLRLVTGDRAGIDCGRLDRRWRTR